jgi:ABC-type nitrate/sulfonate/bicarbonate transport system ATPase subunit
MSAAQLSEAIQKRVVAAWETAEVELDKLRDGKLSEVPAGVHILLKEVIGSLISLKNELSSEADASDKSSKLEGRATIAEELRNLEARKWVAGQADAVTAEVKRLVELERIKLFRKQTTTTGISKKAGVLSEELITEAYVDRFNQELSSLGAKHLRVELVKSGTTQGKMKHKVQLKTLGKDKVKIPDILSEGEQRIVALAAFLADVTGRTCIAPFVFDDPISSLDQKFEERVIRRLVRLSEERQVIIFTHRLSFLSIMSDVAGKTLHDVHIRREPWGAGEPGQVTMFGKRPDKALKNLIGERVPKAKNLWDTEGSETYYPFAKAICSDFRILMERIVETIFLADVVVRHRRAVNTMGKIDNLAKITHEDCKVIGDVMAKYSCYEHSQSDEAPVEVPDPNELEADIQSVIVWLNDFQKRR